MRPTDAEVALRAARESRRTLPPFTDDDPTLDEAWGYAVQAADRAHRTAQGETVVGAKLGLTSEAKQLRMGVDQPIVGFLTDAMRLEPEQLPSTRGAWAQPRIEPEVAFLTAREISSPLTLLEAARAVEGVAVAAEVIDSRYTGYRFRLPDVIADATSAAGFVLGPWQALYDGIPDLQCSLEVDGAVAHAATGAAILGHPLRALVHLSRHIGDRGESVPAGSVVLAGAMTDAAPLVGGSRYTVRTDALGLLELPA